MSKFRVTHFPQVGNANSFCVHCDTEMEVALIVNTLSLQHLWLFNNKFIPDYANVLIVESYNEDDRCWEAFENPDNHDDWEDHEEKTFNISSDVRIKHGFLKINKKDANGEV